MSKFVRLTFDQAIDFIALALHQSGAGKKESLSVAKALVLAETDGQYGHGFSRIKSYISQLKCGKVNASTKIKVSHPYQATTLINADSGFAYPALDLAIENLVKKTREFGISSCSIINSHHCGSLGIQVEKLANQGLIALMLANTPKAIAPWGANQALFGTNPIAFATPRKNDLPLVIDLSLSKVARGKIVSAKKNGEKIPFGWSLDESGNDTSNPIDALNGTMMPIAEAKGTALALMVEIFSAVHSPTNLSQDASSFFDDQGDAPNVGQFLMAFLPGQTNSNEYFERLNNLLSSIASLKGARLPGEKKQQMRKKARLEGLDIDLDLFNEIKGIMQ